MRAILTAFLGGCAIEAQGPEDASACKSPSTWYADADGDGAGTADFTTEACEQP